jgi:chain length determinant protein (polysaccharide antigen chain regulator)
MAKKEIEQFDDEIDLLELIQSLWKEKVLIVAITVVITLIGGGVAFLLTPIYEASVKMLPPSQSDVAELAKFDVLRSSQSQSQSQSQSYADFLQILKSNQLRKAFLSQEGVKTSLFSPRLSSQEAFIELEEMVVVKTPKKDPKTEVSLNFQFKDATLAADYANQLVQLAVDQYRVNIAKTFASEKDQEVKKLKDKKASLISTHEGRLNTEITKLKEAQQIAEKLNIIEPRESKDQTVKTEARSSVITEEMRYLYSQGTRALSAEIETVKGRQKNLAMVDGLLGIEQRFALLNSVSFDVSKVMPVTIDLAAEAPEQRIKPKRSLIVALSGVVGGMLAIMFVLIRNAVRNRKA